MNEIIQEDPSVLALLGLGKRPDSGSVKGSRFNFFVEDDQGGVLIFNTLSNCLIRTDQSTAELLKNREAINVATVGLDFDKLFESRIIVSSKDDELSLYRSFYAVLLQLRHLRKGMVRYNILTTTACNARCFYCFEGGIKQEHMTRETACSVADYILDSHSSTEEIHLRWFGGEPLLNPEAISLICKRCKDVGINFYSTLSTNGWHLDDTMLKRAIQGWNLAKVRFSFDGTRAEHNRRKAFIEIGDAFSKTLDHMRNTIKAGVHVVVRYTLDLENEKSLWALARELVLEFRDIPNVTMYAKGIGQETSSTAYLQNPERVLRTQKAVEDLNDWLHSIGKFDLERIKPAGIRIHNCAANDPRCVVISPTGLLSSCECFCTPANQWGDVRRGITDASRWERWRIPKKLAPQCEICSLIPMCTPFAADCPWGFYDCHRLFGLSLARFMRENFRRRELGKQLIPFSDNFAQFSVVKLTKKGGENE